MTGSNICNLPNELTERCDFVSLQHILRSMDIDQIVDEIPNLIQDQPRVLLETYKNQDIPLTYHEILVEDYFGRQTQYFSHTFEQGISFWGA